MSLIAAEKINDGEITALSRAVKLVQANCCKTPVDPLDVDFYTLQVEVIWIKNFLNFWVEKRPNSIFTCLNFAVLEILICQNYVLLHFAKLLNYV